MIAQKLSSRLHRRVCRGFTLVELMIVVVVLGILAAVATVAFTRYVKRSKTAEALHNIQSIYHGQVTYYDYSGERFGVASFVSIPDLTPSGTPGSAKYPPNIGVWTGREDWSALGFSIATGHYYAYKVDSSAGGDERSSGGGDELFFLAPGDSFSARAVGNLDGDAVQSTFSSTGIISESGELQREPLEIVEELE
jgi:prepilin-type N-terminal cleavage/methylation domain-containing protein